MCNTHFQDNGSTNIYNCNTKIIHCTYCSTVVEIKLHQFSKFSTPLRNSSQVVNLLQICPPLQFCLKFVFQISPPAPNLSTRVAPLLQICLKCVYQTCHLFRFSLNFFPSVPLLQILHTSSLSSKCLYIYW